MSRWHAYREGYYLYAVYKNAKIYTTKNKELHAELDEDSILAYTTGECIFVRSPRYVCKQIILHEYKHVEQWRRYGCFFAIWNYTLELATKGYFKNKFEVQAREAEKNAFTKRLLKKV